MNQPWKNHGKYVSCVAHAADDFLDLGLITPAEKDAIMLRFAAGVDRSIIEKGAEMLGVELGELITDTIMGMREVAEEIGLKGNAEN